MKVKKECTLYNDNIEYVKRLKEERSASSFSAALDIIISEHKKNNGEQINALADIFIQKIDEKYGNLFTRLRLGVGTADKNSQVIIEILNSMVLNQEMDRVYSTEVLEADITKESKEIVTKRIENYKQRKNHKEYN